ncbi:pantothenate kinase 1 [Vigna radiata var. radiata]|uniref:Pantothenate kinase 1 n=1 Tax=Vigna radiata var. radiata TaxID=3916 RepID=A0A1S3VYZ4_VIGRR|nr:pantothenate kinase 1 [Vigna radiata var. radiata]XP_022632467.1 pantothenate kinase 1 [Vigna radiata var. radiata]
MDLRDGQTQQILDPNQPTHVYHLALDIGGSLAKLVYFTKDDNHSVDGEEGISHRKTLQKSNGHKQYPVLNGRLNFKKFETSKINDCLEFIKSMKLHIGGIQPQENPGSQPIAVKATGGGAYKYADLFKERLGIILDKEDEMDCLVAGANFLLEVVHQEAFTYMGDQKQFVQIDKNDLYPYLLVNIGSGVGMIKVEGEGKFERVSGTSIGGGTFWGLGKLLTKCKSFDELLELSYRGNNRAVDMLVGDIYGGMDYSKIGLSSTAIASSFGKAISDNREREDYKPEDIARSLLRMISNNIGQISYLNALRFGLKRIFFGGFFIRKHPFTMDTLSVAVNFWSKGEAKAMFLRHEGFLGAVGSFMSSDKHGLKELLANEVVPRSPSKLSFAVDKILRSLPDGEFNGDESIECSVYAA